VGVSWLLAVVYHDYHLFHARFDRDMAKAPQAATYEAFVWDSGPSSPRSSMDRAWAS
jgi:hypothetical protein